MIIGCPKEITVGENRVALTPSSAIDLQKLGFTCQIESNAGINSQFSNIDYKKANVKIVKNSKDIWKNSDIILKVRPPLINELLHVKLNSTIISFLWPSQNKNLLNKMSKLKMSAIAMDMIPRISRAQKMDALSSMANIAGYRSVIEASNHFGRFFTGQITAAGKVPPAKVLVIGAGVAGLAAIGTAQSLGAIVRSFDVRPEVSEQINSMGAEFLMLDFPSDGSGEGGYAKPASKEFIKKEMELFARQAVDIDIVITTALVPSKKAPLLWPSKIVKLMKPGSIVVDLAAEQGGNCELTKPGKIVITENNIKIIGYTDFPSKMATQSSNLYSNNLKHMLDDLTKDKNGKININMNDDVIRSSTVLLKGKLVFPPPPLAEKSSHKVNSEVSKIKDVDIKEQKLLNEKLKVRNQLLLLIFGGFLMILIGSFAPSNFMQHFTVFVLSCFIGFQVIWNVSHSLHTPLMAVTNAISGIIIIGALLQINSSNFLVSILASISVLIATINIVGGFLVTKRMLSMFKKS